MRISEILSAALTIADLTADEKSRAIAEIVDCICAVHSEIDRALALSVLLERERLGSTGVGQGLAIPHAKLRSLSRVIAAFARSSRGVAFGALDSQPVHLFLVLLAPEGAAGPHLKALARASRLFKAPEFRARLLAEGTSDALFRLIVEEDERLLRADEIKG